VVAELEGLFDGAQAEAALRIGVPPFKVLGSESRGWLGEAAAELVSANLTHAQGVSVLERGELTRVIEELKRLQHDVTPESVGKISSVGKLLGANLLIIGRVVEVADDAFTLVLKPVRVEDGVLLAAQRFRIGGADWDLEIEPAVGRLLKSIGGGEVDVPASASPPLTRTRLELAARARTLQYQGHAAEALPLYEQALQEESNAWSFESDYVRLLLEVGMTRLAFARSTSLLARMPKVGGSCERARALGLHAQAAVNLEDAKKVDLAQEAIRASASCADKTVMAQALLVYHWAVDDIDYAAAALAMKYANERLGGAGESAWIRCYLDHDRYWNLRYTENDWQGSPSERWLQIAEQCQQAGNLGVASIALQNAASASDDPEQQSERYARAIELARFNGGGRLDRARVARASNLRERGQVSEADEELLALLGERVQALVKLHGGLPADVGRLDDELLERLHVQRGGVAHELSGSDVLLGKGHRSWMAYGLRTWADRTAPDSQRQSDEYRAIADALDPPGLSPCTGSPEERLACRLERDRLPFAKILEQQAPPPRNGDADPTAAFDAVHDAFWALRGDSLSKERARDMVLALHRLADWTQKPVQQVIALQVEARQLADAGESERALEKARASARYIPDDPSRRRFIYAFESELLAKEKPGVASEARAQYNELSKRMGKMAWVDALGSDAQAVLRAGQAWQASVKALLEAAKELDDAGSHEAAAAAVVHAVKAMHEAVHVDGSPEAVELYEIRARYLDELGDPVRSVQARVDVMNQRRYAAYHRYRGGAERQLAADRSALALMADIAERLEALVAQGRYRDAVRVVQSLQSESPGAMQQIEQSLSWAKHFEDSAEYPMLAAGLQMALAWTYDAFPPRRAAFEQAVALYERIQNAEDSAWAQSKVLVFAPSEDAMWSDYEKCRGFAGSKSSYRKWCVEAIGNYVLDREKTLNNVAAAKAALAQGLELIDYVDRWHQPSSRMSFRVSMAAVAAMARDFATWSKLGDEVRTYFKVTSPDAYMLVTKLQMLARPMRRIAPARAVALYQEFDAANGASDYWKATAYPEYAAVARRAGDKQAERSFIAKGRAAAASQPIYLVYYDLLPASAAVDAKRWRAAAEAYEKAEAALRRAGPEETLAIGKMQLARAAALIYAGDYRAARASLAPAAKQALENQRDGTSETPCRDAWVLEEYATAEGALGACQAHGEARREAAELRLQCRKQVCQKLACEGDATYRAPATCRGRIAIDTSVFE
jgi:hypothetical protein